MSWQLGVISVLAVVLLSGGLWFERSRPPARILAAVAALAALGVAGRVALAPLPNVVGTTDVTLLAGYTLGGPAGFAVGALAALVSNFWLGQGPWTPWQMAGWGMVGIGGALLAAAAGRRLGRVGLAVAAALAGLLYGALLDLSTMVNFGGEQSLDRYLALSARGIPFNVAHALGNAAIMLAVGPALVRMLERYRERFQVDWRETVRPGASAAAPLLALALALSLLGPVRGPAATARAAEAPGASGAGRAPAAANEQPADEQPASGSAPGRTAPVEPAGAGDARRWLARAQNRDGGWGTTPGGPSSAGMTGWAMLGLEAAGRNPLDVRSHGRSPVDYLRREAGGLTSTGDLERTILALRGAGVPARKFAGRDLYAELRSRQGSNGSYQKQVNLTAFAILARSAAGEGDGSLGKAAGWLKAAQNQDGGWGSTAKAPSEPDSTGAALQALKVIGASGPLVDGARWLRRAQHADGGWSLTRGADTNSQSTAWALQGLLAAGADAGAVRKGARNGFEYLGARRAGDGHYAYSKASDQTPVWVTAQALTAVERRPFPYAPVARKPHRRSKSGDGKGSHAGGGSKKGGATSPPGAGSRARGAGGASGGPRGSAPARHHRSHRGGGAAARGHSTGADRRPNGGGDPTLPRLDGRAAEAAAVAGEPAAGDGGDGIPPALVLAAVNVLAAVALVAWLLWRDGAALSMAIWRRWT